MRILLAVDGSSCSQAAIDEVARRTWPPETEVCVVTAEARAGDSMLAASTLGEPSLASTAYDEAVAEERGEAEDCLRRSAERLERAAPTLTVSTVLLDGSPTEELIAFASRWSADLVVVGSRGRGAVTSLLLGSVSLEVALNAPCSVLIVREGGTEVPSE